MYENWYTVKVFWEDSFENESSNGHQPVAIFRNYDAAKDFALLEMGAIKQWATLCLVSIWQGNKPLKEFKYEYKLE